jgi:cell fate (sporulation/competence/biofilm development) regulator YlbF (YheA/YmcA/DUF963 family)
MSQANVYDNAHLLAQALRGSREYADFRLAAARLQGEKSALGMMRDFRGRQLEMQARLLQGEEVSPEEQERFATLSDLVTSHVIIAGFLRAEYGLSRLLADIQKIIADAVDVDLGEGDDAGRDPTSATSASPAAR